MATLRVPADYPSVAAAVAAASPGDVIHILAGYDGAEDIVVTADNLTFNNSSSLSNVTLTLSGVSKAYVVGTHPLPIVSDPDGATIHSGREASTITGLDGNDRIIAGAGDVVAAGGGGDIIFLSGTPASIDGGGGADLVRITGNVAFAADSVFGVELFSVAGGVTADFGKVGYGVTARSLTQAGGPAETLRGTAFADTFYSGNGADHFSGNGGTDTVSYLYAPTGVTADLAHPLGNMGAAAGDTYTGIESLLGSNHDDVLLGDSAINFIDGGKGNDIITAGAGDTVHGGLGNDTIIINGTAYGIPLIIDGDTPATGPYSAGSNTLLVTGDATVPGGWGASGMTHIAQIEVADGVTADFSAGHGGFFSGLFISESVAGGGSKITAFGTMNYLTTELRGGEGADTLIGSDHNRAIFVLKATPALVDGRVAGGQINVLDDISVTATNVKNVDTFFAWDGVDLDLSHLSYGNIKIYASSSGTTIVGSQFDDRIYSGFGADHLTGGAGADSFVYRTAVGSLPTAHDVIEDFTQGQDKIDLWQIRGNDSVSHALEFIGSTAFSGTAGEFRQVDIGGHHFVDGDLNGDRMTDFRIELEHAVILTTNDFVLAPQDPAVF